MSLSFMSLPLELRQLVYEEILLYPEAICPWNHLGLREMGIPLPLRMNKTIHAETSLFFYSRNCFNFSGVTAKSLSSFLDQIGPRNAAYMRRIVMDFPQVRQSHSGPPKLDEDAAQLLAAVRSSCMGLKTIVTSLYSSRSLEIQLHGLDSPKVAATLELVHGYFSTMPSLREIIVEIFEDGTNENIRKQMTSLGWIIDARPVEHHDFDTDFNDAEWYHDFFSDMDKIDDIDFDSDFWRREEDDD